MDEPSPSPPPRWHCDVCEGAAFGSAQEKARHFVSKRHAICLDNRHKADHRHHQLVLHGGGGGAGKTREEAERAKERVALLKAERAAANELHARQEAALVRLQLLDEALNNYERRIAEKGSANGDDDDDDERGAWSEKKQKLFMGRIYGVLSAHGIEPGQVLNVYRWGSRWWGHHSPRSDYDFIVLVRDWDQPSTQNVLEGEEIDMAVYEVNIFQQLINQHVPWTCVFLSHPPEGILLERHKLHWEFRAHKWLGGVRKNMFKNYNIAKQYWQYGEIKRSKKRFIYVVKHWALSLQMAKTQKVTDRHVVNDLALSLMSMHFPNWKAFHQWYREYADTVETALKELTQSYKQFELDWWQHANATPEASGDDHCLVAVSYVNQNGFGELVKNLDVNVELVNDSGEVSAVGGNNIDRIVAGGTQGHVVLSSEKVGSPASSRITFECHGGLVLARSCCPGASGATSWRPIAQAFPRYRHFYPFHGSDKKRTEEDEVWTIIKAKQVGIEDLSDIDWSSAEAREMIDGHLGLLFYHSGKWCVQMKTRKDTSRADLVKEFWRLYAAQGITDKSLNTSWCYIFQLVSRQFPRFMKYNEDALVLVGVRDFGSFPLGREVDLDHALASQLTSAGAASTAFCSNGEGSHDNATTAVGWRTPQRFPNLRDQEAMVRKVRRQSPLSFKGLIISDRAPQDVTASTPSAMMSASSCRRVVLSSPAYLWLAKLRALETWELEGDWDDEEGGEGEIDFAKERERCLFELMLLFMQWRSRQQTRTRRGEKGKWKRLRLQRRAPAACTDDDSQTTPSATTATSASTTPGTTSDEQEEEEAAQEEQRDEQEEKEETERDHEEERFLELHGHYRADYLAVKATFIETCLQVEMRYTQLNRLFPSMKDWARECEKERYKPLLFVLKKRGFPSVRSFYTDYESMHEPRVEKVSYYILDYMHESTQDPHHATPTTTAQPAGPKKPLYPWQG